MSEPAGLVLGHRVVIGKFRGRITSLDPDVTVWLDRLRWSDAFKPGDRVRVDELHTDREPMEATVIEAARGTLCLRLVNNCTPSSNLMVGGGEPS